MSVARNIARVLEGILDSLRDDANAAAARTTLGVGAGDTPTFTGVTASGDGTIADSSGALHPSVLGSVVDVSSGSPSEAAFTGIPSWATRITVSFVNISLSGNEHIIAQLGTSGGYVATGYDINHGSPDADGTSPANNTTGAHIGAATAAATFSGVVRFTKHTGNVWVLDFMTGFTSSASLRFGAGHVDAGGTVDRVRLVRTTSATFDSGSVNMTYE